MRLLNVDGAARAGSQDPPTSLLQLVSPLKVRIEFTKLGSIVRFIVRYSLLQRVKKIRFDKLRFAIMPCLSYMDQTRAARARSAPPRGAGEQI